MAGADRVLLLSRLRTASASFMPTRSVGKVAGVRHVVRVSALARIRTPVLLARSHGECERELEASGMPTRTCARTPSCKLLRLSGDYHTYGLFYGCVKDGRVAMVDARDIAAVCAECLTGTATRAKPTRLRVRSALDGDAARF